MTTEVDYLQFRGKCKEMSEAAVLVDPSLRVARGHYYCPVWGEQQHWWTVRPDGTVYDPTAAQFPSNGSGVYVEFDGMVACANCDKEIHEADVEHAESRYVFCSYRCHGQFVGAF